jgi:RimJ/RimL family protein N-acetyltransferase
MARLRETGLGSIKIDTHPDNYKMKAFLHKQGFVPIGYLAIIHRDAYELVLEATT